MASNMGTIFGMNFSITSMNIQAINQIAISYVILTKEKTINKISENEKC